MRAILLVLVFVVVLAGCDFTVPPTPVATPTPASTATSTVAPLTESKRLDIFTEVWGTVRDNYVYENFNGLDWNAIREEFRPRVVASTSASQFHTVMTEMMKRLDDDHSYFLTPQEAQEQDAGDRGDTHYVGIGIGTILRDRAICVMYVYAESPAEEAGLKRGDCITLVNGERISDNEDDPSTIRGPEGTTVTITVRSPDFPLRELQLNRHTIRGTITPWSVRLGTDQRIGYLVIPSLSVYLMSAGVTRELSDLVTGDEPLEGLVIDLRGNGGGSRDVLSSILGHFARGRLGSFHRRGSDSTPLDAGKISQPGAFVGHSYYETLKDVPLVMLVDDETQSNAEVLAVTLQTSGRAHIVGAPSSGNTEAIYSYNLKDGSRVWVAEEIFRLPDGTSIEGKGVAPDVPIEVDWTEYAEKDDPHILKAVELIRQGR